MLKFLSISPNKSKDKHIKWVCECDCGDVSEYLATRVRTGRKTQCAKCSKKMLVPSGLKHGMKNTGTYQSWSSMKDRCLNKNSKDYPAYGARGITVCDSWAMSFEAFYKDMGEKPKGCSIDRIDNTKGYFPENCRWASRSEQQRNKSNSCSWIVKGLHFETMKEASDHFKVSKETISRWVNGWVDKRRNKTWSPRNDCKRIEKY
jgi:dTDP-4-dehydrorhamnose 3,5-epimerase-like enzyme